MVTISSGFNCGDKLRYSYQFIANRITCFAIRNHKYLNYCSLFFLSVFWDRKPKDSNCPHALTFIPDFATK